jgi:DNA-binding MarR family transcriptional regulator
MRSRTPPDLWSALSSFRKRVLDRMQGGLAGLGLDLSLPQATALTLVADVGPLTVSALQKRLRRSQATTSHLVTQLELRGLVERAEDPADARRTLIRLSKEGRRLMDRLERLRRQSFESVLAHVPDAVQAQLHAALVATIDALEEGETQ